jgi:DNA-directed RNA polymerase specialized sigma24 family protein
MEKPKLRRKIRYEDKQDVIDRIIEKHRYIWQLKAIAWMDYDDVAQIIRFHVSKKWKMWKQDRPLEPWISRITVNQIKNLLRNNYSNYVRPCLACKYNQGNEPPACSITPSGLQCSECPMYSKWEKTKKSAYDVKLAVSTENHSETVQGMRDLNFDVLGSAQKLHEEMKHRLAPKQYKVYSRLYIDGADEEKVAAEMGYKTNEKGKKAGYKQIKNLKKLFRSVAIKILQSEDILGGYQ